MVSIDFSLLMAIFTGLPFHAHPTVFNFQTHFQYVLRESCRMNAFNRAEKKFKGDEILHKNIAFESGATNKGIYSIMDKIIKSGSRIAITISEKI